MVYSIVHCYSVDHRAFYKVDSLPVTPLGPRAFPNQIPECALPRPMTVNVIADALYRSH